MIPKKDTVINKAKQVLAEADTGSEACKRYNDGFLDGIHFVYDNFLNPLQKPPKAPPPESARYILFMLDSKYKDHDGKIFCSYQEAREYASDCLAEEWYCNKAVIGMFTIDTQAREMLITMVETIGFKGDKKRVQQLQLFASANH